MPFLEEGCRRRCLVAVMLLLATAGVSAANDPRALLEQHNEWRRELDPELPPMTWDDAMAQSAQEWSERLDRKKSMEHESPLPAEVFGENLSFGDEPVSAAQLWYREKGEYAQVVKAGKTCSPKDLSMAKYIKCGHYANIVDRRFTKLGCGMSGSYLTCRYR